MSITVKTSEILSAARLASVATGTRHLPSILSGVRLSSGGAELTVEAFDYELGVRRTLPGTGDGLEPIVVEAKGLIAQLRAFAPRQDVELANDAGRLTMRQGARVVQLSAVGAMDEWPALPDTSKLPHRFSTQGATFAEIATTVAPFAGKDATLPVLTCVQLSYDHGELTAAATDRFRLARRTFGLYSAANNDEGGSFVVPRFAHIARQFSTRPGDIVSVSADERGTMLLDSGDVTVTMRLSDGDFPRTEQLLKTMPAVATFVSDAALSAVKMAGAACERNTALRVYVGNESVTFVGGNADDGEAIDRCGARETAEFAAGYDPSYFADVLKAFGKGADVTMHAETAGKPASFESAAVDGLTILLMPRRMPGEVLPPAPVVEPVAAPAPVEPVKVARKPRRKPVAAPVAEPVAESGPVGPGAEHPDTCDCEDCAPVPPVAEPAAAPVASGKRPTRAERKAWNHELGEAARAVSSQTYRAVLARWDEAGALRDRGVSVADALAQLSRPALTVVS